MPNRIVQQAVYTAHTENASALDLNTFDVGSVVGAYDFSVGCFIAEVVGVGQTSGHVNAYRLALHWKTEVGVPGTIVAVGSCGSGLTCEEDAAWDATLTSDGGDFVARLTGAAAEHVEWTVWATLVGYGQGV
jgi:hypothetical protein